jgi:ABC-2 type transport system permease protein
VKPEGLLSFIHRTFAEACRDPRTLLITFLAPSFIFILQWYVLSVMTTTVPLNIAVVNEDTGMGNVSFGNLFAAALGQQDNVSVAQLSRGEVEDALKSGSIDGAVIFGPDFTKGIVTKQGSKLEVVAEGTDQTKYALITRAVSGAATTAAARAAGNSSAALPVTADISKRFAASMGPVDLMKPMIMSLLTFLLGFITAFLYAFGRKAKALASGVSKLTAATGFTLGLWAFAFVQGVTIMLYYQYGIGIGTDMDLVAVSAMILAVSLAGVACGVLASAVARKGEHGLLLAIGFLIIQIYFSGIAVAVSRFPDWVQAFSYVLPLTYARHALNDLIARGYGFGDVWTDALALVVIAAAAVLLAAPVLGRKEKVKTAPELKTN